MADPVQKALEKALARAARLSALDGAGAEQLPEDLRARQDAHHTQFHIPTKV